MYHEFNHAFCGRCIMIGRILPNITYARLILEVAEWRASLLTLDFTTSVILSTRNCCSVFTSLYRQTSLTMGVAGLHIISRMACVICSPSRFWVFHKALRWIIGKCKNLPDFVYTLASPLQKHGKHLSIRWPPPLKLSLNWSPTGKLRLFRCLRAVCWQMVIVSKKTLLWTLPK